MMLKPVRLALFLLSLLLNLAAARADILIGAAAPLSGPNAALGEQLRRGVQKAVDDINATGGIRGEKLAVDFADDGCDPRKAIDVATGFVSAGVKAVIGHYCSGASIPASKVYQKAGILQISPASTNPKFTDEGGWNVVRLVPRDDAQAGAAAALVVDRFPGRKVAILSDQSPGFTALAARFAMALQQKGVTPALQQAFKAGTKDFAPLARQVAESGAGVVYLAGSYVEGGLIAQALRAAGSQAQIISGDSLVTEDYGNQAKAAAEGTLSSFTFDARKFPSAQGLVQRFRDADQNPEGFTLYAYAAVQALAAAAEATGTLDSTRLAEWLRGGNRFDTVVGPLSFDARGDLTAPAIAWFKWVDGRYVEVDARTLAPPLLDTTP
ncbi:branched-chain amino acid ABC transporter substrate-binding protein [Aestuariivirga litoralis]|uniref:Branched-chain amino acid ABC transporter substrate-binding protein n=1 Tax=Aestuariivirga litoralis TaxID=2650924 RepID=A0A2W2AJI7_9HYPH|nr:branched-chain amino acid ABC transporter substrate-binding protein [Aestuariivirga litoralis]PZF75461.1 branched-chain amino acid ABC transporter substrate-binding protein [Aestuariivirga litoralis]